jgi:exonuclease III
VWRRRNPRKQIFTYRGKGKSRIDFWLLNKTLDHAITKCEIIENPITTNDHCAITLELNLETRPQGDRDLENE